MVKRPKVQESTQVVIPLCESNTGCIFMDNRVFFFFEVTSLFFFRRVFPVTRFLVRLSTTSKGDIPNAGGVRMQKQIL